MSNTRLALKSKTWSKLQQHLGKLSEQITPEIHCHVPLCIGYKESVSSIELAALMQEIAEKRYAFTIYLSPKNDQALKEWIKANDEVLRKIPEHKIVLIEKWRKNNAWLSAKEKYQQYSDGEKGETVVKMIDTDMRNFSKRNKDVPAEEIKEHVINEVVDCLSWMKPVSPASINNNVLNLNVLLYPHNLTQAMRNAIQNADKMGYMEDSIIHSKFEFAMVPVNQSRTSQPSQFRQRIYSAPTPNTHDLVDRVILTFAQNGTNLDYAIRFTAGLYEYLTQAPENAPSAAESQTESRPSSSSSLMLQRLATPNEETYTVSIPSSQKLVAIDVDLRQSDTEANEKTTAPSTFFGKAAIASSQTEIPSPAKLKAQS